MPNIININSFVLGLKNISEILNQPIMIELGIINITIGIMKTNIKYNLLFLFIVYRSIFNRTFYKNKITAYKSRYLMFLLFNYFRNN